MTAYAVMLRLAAAGAMPVAIPGGPGVYVWAARAAGPLSRHPDPRARAMAAVSVAAAMHRHASQL